MIPFIKRRLLEEWPKLGLGERPDDLLFIKFADRGIRRAEVSIISSLVKGKYRGEEKPLFIFRFPRYAGSSEARSSLETEFSNLNVIHGKLDDQTVPKVVYWGEINDYRVLAVSFLPGAPLSRQMLSDNILRSYIGNFGLAFSWLVNWQKAFGSAGQITLAELPALALPRWPQHGDYHADNIFVLEGAVSGVIDWEDFELAGAPCFDLYHFIRTYFEGINEYFAKTDRVEELSYFTESREVGTVVRATIDNYYQLAGIDPQAEKVLLSRYLSYAASLAASPRKRAEGALKRLNILLKLAPSSIEELLFYQSVFNYGEIYQRAKEKQAQRLIELSRSKISEIQKRATEKAGE